MNDFWKYHEEDKQASEEFGDKSYIVRWEMELSAASPEEAARICNSML